MEKNKRKNYSQWSFFFNEHVCAATWHINVHKRRNNVETRVPVRLKSAHSFSLFLMLLSECDGNAFFVSSILILRGVSLLFQNSR